MKLHLDLPDFRCPKSLAPHLRSVFEGEYEVPLWGSDKVILDCGANVGAFALWAAHRWPGSTIHCYEPNPECLDLLSENTAGIDGIYVNPYGLGEPGERVLHSGKNNLGEASLYPNPCSSDLGRHVRIESPLKASPADIIKIDCEGSELEILAPLIEDGRRFEAIMLEWHRMQDRILLDTLLMEQYVLTGSAVYEYEGRGLSKYVRKDLL